MEAATTQHSDFYTVEQAAQVLNKSRSWVYRHAPALGAFQPRLGCALSIPVKVIEAINANLTTTARYVRSLGITSDRLSETFDRFEEKATAPKVVAFRAVK